MLRDESELVDELFTIIRTLYTDPPPTTALPAPSSLSHARESLAAHLPDTGLGLCAAVKHLTDDIAPALGRSGRSPNYYGFVIGGSTPAASLADNLVTAVDENVHSYLPSETIAVEVEDRALSLLCEPLDLHASQWPHRIFTTGATASHMLGLACAREHVIVEATALRSGDAISVGQMGVHEAMRRAGLDRIQILTTAPHSSLFKAASIVGLGRDCVQAVGQRDAPHRFDMEHLKRLLEKPTTASIVVVSASEVNAGLFATSGLPEMQEIRRLCDCYGAWTHVDGAFGMMGRILRSPSHQLIISCCQGLELADSITGDCHKLLNVPYDCGYFLSRHAALGGRVFQNPHAAYLSAHNAESGGIPSPLNLGNENSRRFRALPVYASLIAYGTRGNRDMLERQIELARAFASYVLDSPAFELLPPCAQGADDAASREERLSRVFITVLFRARDTELNSTLVEKIKQSRKIYVSGSSWDGRAACRFAVSHWRADVQRDLPIIKSVLEDIVQGHQRESV